LAHSLIVELSSVIYIYHHNRGFKPKQHVFDVANKLTPEEAISEIKKGLKKCLDSAYALHNEFVGDSSFDLQENSVLYTTATLVDKTRHKIENALNQNDLNNLAENLQKIAMIAHVGLETVKLGMSKTKYVDFFKKTIPFFQNIKEEIAALQAICKQFTK